MRLIHCGHKNHGTWSDFYFNKVTCSFSTRTVHGDSSTSRPAAALEWVAWSGRKGQCPPKKTKTITNESVRQTWVFNLHFATNSELSSKMYCRFRSQALSTFISLKSIPWDTNTFGYRFKKKSMKTQRRGQRSAVNQAIETLEGKPTGSCL